MIRLRLLAVLLPGLFVLPLGCGGGAEEGVGVTYKPKERGGNSTITTGGNGSGGNSENGSNDGSEATGEPGTLVGRVVFTGNAPNLGNKDLPQMKPEDAAICAAEPIPDQSLIVGDDGGVANVFVYIKRMSGRFDPPTESVVFDQRGCVFKPHCLAVQVGQPMIVKNSDPIPHNTNAQTKRADALNVKIEPNGEQTLANAYNKAENFPVAVGCDYHAWMRAYHLPVAHPFFAVTDETGSFRIENIPPGKYTFIAWHEAANTGLVGLLKEWSVEIKGGEQTENIDFPSSVVDLAAARNRKPDVLVSHLLDSSR